MLKLLKNQFNFKFALLILTTFLSMSFAEASEQEAWEALKQGKAVALMRHAYAPPTNETSPISPEKCAGERNLSPAGAKQAKDIAATLRANNITEAEMFSSYLCRCIDTAVLFDFGEVKNLPEINGFGGNRERGVVQSEELRKWIKESIKSQPSKPQILVSHGLNITGLMDTFADQGDVLIIGMKDDKLVNLHQFSTSFF